MNSPVTMMRTLLARLRGALHGGPAEAELGEELAAHRAMLIDDGMRCGLSRTEAHRQAHLALGSHLAIREAVREQAGFPILESVWQDARYGIRSLLNATGFTVAAVITLAIGIGASTAMFSVVNTVLLRP